VDESREIERFACGDDTVAAEALGQLRPRIERFLSVALRDMLPSEADREDAIGETLRKLWDGRKRFVMKGVKPWWAFVLTTGRRCALNILGHPKDEPLREDMGGEVAPPSWSVRPGLYRAADELWLGIPPDMSESGRQEKLLAAQLFYLHERTWEKVVPILGESGSPSRATLDIWLADPAVVADLAYAALYVDAWRLVGWLLKPDRSVSPEKAEALFQAAQAEPAAFTSCGLPSWKVLAVGLRFRYGMFDDKIVLRLPDIPEADLREFLEECSIHLPFKGIVITLRRKLDSHRLPTPFGGSSLWKRLVFQYGVAHCLPHKQIIERTPPDVVRGQFRLTMDTLNVWLSAGRLGEALTKHMGGGKRDAV
jgi:DNA-directed RNA polymerase specialized sigma24 family protein